MPIEYAETFLCFRKETVGEMDWECDYFSISSWYFSLPFCQSYATQTQQSFFYHHARFDCGSSTMSSSVSWQKGEARPVWQLTDLQLQDASYCWSVYRRVVSFYLNSAFKLIFYYRMFPRAIGSQLLQMHVHGVQPEMQHAVGDG